MFHNSPVASEILADSSGTKLCSCPTSACNEDWGRCILDACCPIGKCVG